MKPFSLKEYLANPTKKIITRDGKPVDIVYINEKATPFPIACLIDREGDNTRLVTVDENGRRMCDSIPSIDDVFFVTEKKEGWINIRHSVTWGTTSIHQEIFSSREEAQKYADSNTIQTIKIEWEE